MKDYLGFGALGEALLHLESRNFATIFVVASENAWRRFNSPQPRPFFSERKTVLFSDFSPNPDFSEILAGSKLIRTVKPDCIVAFGGGSPIDVAKAIKAEAFTKEPYDAEEPQRMKPSGEGPPLVAIVTTSGSGAEATPYSVFYVGKKKQSLSHPSLRPEMAVVDPEMSYSLPPAQTASTGFDALAQAIEAYWSSLASSQARELGKTAIGYILPNLYNAVHTPQPGNRYHMAQAAYLAGEAIAITGTTNAHALAYHLTQEYGLPHGHAVALTLPYFFLMNVDESLAANMPGGREEVTKTMEEVTLMLGQKNAEDCFIFWRNLMKACGLAHRLVDVGVDTPEKTAALVNSMDMTKLSRHPVQIVPEQLTKLFLSRP